MVIRHLLIACLISIALTGICQGTKTLTYLLADIHTPTARIDSIALITDDFRHDSARAQDLIKAKVLLPLAMQQHDAALFNRVLASDYIYHEPGRFMDVVLEFYPDMALLTYHNVVQETDEYGKPQTFTWFWADIWVLENGIWKIKVLRALN